MVRIAAAVGGALLMASSAMSQVLRRRAPSWRRPGTLRAGINYGNAILATKDSATGQSRGVAIELGRNELARRLGVPVELVAYTSVATMVDGAKTGGWDIAFLGADPARAGEISFTAPYLELEATYLVPAGSPLRAIDRCRPRWRARRRTGPGRVRAVPEPEPEDAAARARPEFRSGHRPAGVRRGRGPGGADARARGYPRAGARVADARPGSSSRCSRRSVFPRAATPGCSTSGDSSRRPRPSGLVARAIEKARAFAACRSLPRPPPPSAHARTRIAPPASTPREESFHAVRPVHDAAAPAPSPPSPTATSGTSIRSCWPIGSGSARPGSAST